MLSEQQFVSYLEIVKSNVGEIKNKPHVWLDDDLKDGIRRIWFKKTKFQNIELLATEKAIYQEKFEWIVKNDEAKLASYEVNKICDKPCTIGIGKK